MYLQSPPPLVTGRRARKSFWKITLMLMAALLVFTSCEEENKIVDLPETLGSTTDLVDMTEEEMREYFKNVNINEFKSDFDKLTIDTLFIKKISQHNTISVRSSFNCVVNVKLSISGPSNTADIAVYEAGTSTLVYGPVSMTHGDDFDMTINGATYYDFKVEPTGT